MDKETLLEHLIEIKEGQAGMRADFRAMTKSFEQHLIDDAVIKVDVADLKKDQQRLKGALTVLVGLGSLGAAIKAWLSLKS